MRREHKTGLVTSEKNPQLLTKLVREARELIYSNTLNTYIYNSIVAFEVVFMEKHI